MFHKNSGFTVVELMLAMVFLSFILVFCATTTVQMLRTYNKGVTIKSINQVGRVLSDEVGSQIRKADSGDVTVLPGLHRICIGDIVYSWSPLYVNNSSGTSLIPNPDTNVNRISAQPAGFVREKSASTICPGDASRNVAANDRNYDLLGTNARVLYADVESQRGGKLTKMTFYVTSYDRSELATVLAGTNLGSIYNTGYIANAYNSATPQATPDNFSPTCNTSVFNNFCYVTSFSTIVYTAN